ncbi:hypothetical protein PoB_007345800 [Plakobranchus ocellatus]|uniref:Uncharacterized protein n=1 Tax=Plakobranchus ocellatus TaxID=259542 RepID=A0AAV4DRP7_9GAST|nr:hypothetical protein PoB_007345800 [Plakobranchus ocellatus]
MNLCSAYLSGIRGTFFQGHCRHDYFRHRSLAHIAGPAVSCSIASQPWPLKYTQTVSAVRLIPRWSPVKEIYANDITYPHNGFGRTTFLQLIFLLGSSTL